MTRSITTALAAPLLAITLVTAQQQTPSTPAPDAGQTVDEGIPVTDQLTRQKCSGCHKADEKGRLTRISYRRTTPEGWQETIKRMVSLNKVKLEPEEARAIVRYLADHHGLAPEEARPAAFEVERRLVEFKYTADKDTEETCTACHSMGRIISQRRTKEEWELLVAMHRGYYPLVDFQAFRRMAPIQRQPGPDGRPPDNRHPMEKAIAHLSTAFPLTTSEWAAWSATMRPPRLDGTWALAGYEPGKGPIYGTVKVASAGGNAAQFTTDIAYVVPATGERVARSGRSIVYTGFQWRGRSTAGGDDQHALREVLFVDKDWRHASGRWFTGAYDELGIDVRLTRVGGDPLLVGTDRAMVKTGGSAEVRLFGANLPARLAPADLNFGPGITVDRVVNQSPGEATVALTVAPAATVGRRSIFIAGGDSDATIAVYSSIDYVKVTPQAGLARVGGANFPKQLAQFEAIGYANGPDGKPDTKDDVELGRVNATWSLEEYTATYADDDKEFVGTIDPVSGLFTPNLDGPNPKRQHGTNNYGDVWVVATITHDPQPLRARAHLLVTVPLYIKWDQSEVGR